MDVSTTTRGDANQTGWVLSTRRTVLKEPRVLSCAGHRRDGFARPAFDEPVQDAFTFHPMVLKAGRSKSKNANLGADYKARNHTL